MKQAIAESLKLYMCARRLQRGRRSSVLTPNIAQSQHTDNSYHVVTCDAEVTDLTTTLDGFTVKLGYADGSHPDNLGGGIYLGGFVAGTGQDPDTPSGKLTVSNCTVTDNFASYYGGGVYVNGLGQIKMIDSTLTNNTATLNGGGYADGQASAAFEDCVFVDNETTSTGAARGGGGAWVGPGGTQRTFLRCRFTGNESKVVGGGLGVSDGTSAEPLLVNCLFYRNDA
ncbi:MAG: hypothetical protein C4547_06590, partial [Phycisphaerales bacterium]